MANKGSSDILQSYEDDGKRIKFSGFSTRGDQLMHQYFDKGEISFDYPDQISDITEFRQWAAGHKLSVGGL
jgi:hypothetical protein